MTDSRTTERISDERLAELIAIESAFVGGGLDDGYVRDIVSALRELAQARQAAAQPVAWRFPYGKNPNDPLAAHIVDYYIVDGPRRPPGTDDEPEWEPLYAAPPVAAEQGDPVCAEDDGCPTERAVLQRFWRAHRGAPPVATCPGIPDAQCRYLADCHTPCNKCGRVHVAPLAAPPVAAGPVAWLLWYEDPDRKPELFSGAGAEEAARARYEQAKVAWDCALFATVATSPAAPKPPVAAGPEGCVAVPRDLIDWLLADGDGREFFPHDIGGEPNPRFAELQRLAAAPSREGEDLEGGR